MTEQPPVDIHHVLAARKTNGDTVFLDIAPIVQRSGLFAGTLIGDTTADADTHHRVILLVSSNGATTFARPNVPSTFAVDPEAARELIDAGWTPPADNPATPAAPEADEPGPRPVGHLLDALGVQVTLEADELPASAVLLLRVIQTDGSERLSMAFSEGQSWVERLGMLTAAHAIETTDIAQCANHNRGDET